VEWRLGTTEGVQITYIYSSFTREYELNCALFALPLSGIRVRL
jgi:hypothetical protein